MQEAADRLDFDHKAAEITGPASYRRFLEAMVSLTSEEELGVTMKRVTSSKNLPVLDVQVGYPVAGGLVASVRAGCTASTAAPGLSVTVQA